MLFCISFVTFISFQFCTNIQEIDNRRRSERKSVIESVGYSYKQKMGCLIKARLPLECCWPLFPKEDVLFFLPAKALLIGFYSQASSC